MDVLLLCLTSERLSPSDRLERGERPTARCVANRRPCRIAFHLHEGLAIAVIHFLPPLLRGRGDHIKGHWTLYSVASAIKRIHLHQLPPSCVRVLLGRGREWRHCISCNAPATAVSTLRRLPQQKKVRLILPNEGRTCDPARADDGQRSYQMHTRKTIEGRGRGRGEEGGEQRAPTLFRVYYASLCSALWPYVARAAPLLPPSPPRRRWRDEKPVIVANPPFLSGVGGDGERVGYQAVDLESAVNGAGRSLATPISPD